MSPWIPAMSLFAKGFRPFFLLAGLFAALIMPAWLSVLTHGAQPLGPLVGPAWHGHELIHGFTVAVISGFLLTAVGNWTGRETAVGAHLLALATLWLLGRLALLLPLGAASSWIDLAFLPALVLTLTRPLLASGNARNAPFPILLTLLWLTSLAEHAPALGLGYDVGAASRRAAIHLIVLMILLITGRILPMFTRNATGADVRSWPYADGVAIALALSVTATQVLTVPDLVTTALSAAAAVAVAVRMIPWWTPKILRQPMLWVLHVGHLMVAVGFALGAARDVVGASLGLHALTVGAIGLLTLGMMARVSLGHTGRPIEASPLVTGAFVALFAAALVRVVGPLLFPSAWMTWVLIAGTLWTAAFAAFAAVYAPILVRPRDDGRPG